MQRLALDSYVRKAFGEPTKRAIIADPSWPEKLAREFADKMKIPAMVISERSASPVTYESLPYSFETLRLNNGRILHDVEVKSFSPTAVMIRHRDGAETVAFQLFPEQY